MYAKEGLAHTLDEMKHGINKKAYPNFERLDNPKKECYSKKTLLRKYVSLHFYRSLIGGGQHFYLLLRVEKREYL